MTSQSTHPSTRELRIEIAKMEEATASATDDLLCESYAIVRIDGDDAIYRCPTYMVFGPYSETPFIPWPAYVEGRSAELKAALDALLANAVVMQ